MKVTLVTIIKGNSDPAKGQIKSPKTRKNDFFLLWRVKKGKKYLHLFFGRIYGTPICLRFYLTFRHFLSFLLSYPPKQFQTIDFARPLLWCYTQLVGDTVPKNEWTNWTTSDNHFCRCACSDLSPNTLLSIRWNLKKWALSSFAFQSF